METIIVDLRLIVNKPEDLNQDALVNQVTDHVYDYFRNGADVQSVQVMKINDREVC